jgi:ATP-dependent exoDNAse (exonuclease V) beta subunit
LQVLTADPEISKEIAQFDTFKRSEWAASRGLRAVRTELCVAWRSAGRSISAGQIDALFVDKAGQYYLFDFKRVKSKHKLDPDEQGFKGATGSGPMADLPDTHFQK